jgi:hypothetical protein
VAGDRHGGAPKGERVGRGFARRDPRVTARPTLALAGATTITRRRLSALRPPFGGHEAKVQDPGGRNAPREREWLFDIVRFRVRGAVHTGRELGGLTASS